MRLDLLVVGVGVLGIEGLVGPHDRDEVLGVGQVGYRVSITGDHLDDAHVRAADDVLVHGEGVAVLVDADLAQLDARGAGDDEELLPLAHVPVVALGDARPAHVYGDLPALGGAEELGKAPARVHVGLQAVGEVARLVVGEERAPELLGEAPVCQVGHAERAAAVAEALQ